MHPYATERYASTLSHVGDPVRLESAGTWVLRRAIPGTDRFDAVGCYPLTTMRSDADLASDFEALRRIGLVSLVVVPDPFFGPDLVALAAAFDVVQPFKSHYVHAPSDPFRYDKHHRYEVKRATTECRVEVVELGKWLDAWCDLYRSIVERHGISGPQAFPRATFERLVDLPGLTAVAAFGEGTTPLSMHLWLESNGYVYSHLGASSENGYRKRASYAIYDHALLTFADRRAIDLGGGAGTDDNPSNGLARFKRGFANRVERSYVCGKILDGAAFTRLSATAPKGDYFPPYRATSTRAEQG